MNPTSNEPSKTKDLRKMGSSIIRHCRRRTQSDPPKKYKRDRDQQRPNNKGTTIQYNLDGALQIDRGDENTNNSNINNSHHVSKDIRTIDTFSTLDNQRHNTSPDELVVVNGIIDRTTLSSNTTPNNNTIIENTRTDMENVALRLRKTSQCSTTETTTANNKDIDFTNTNSRKCSSSCSSGRKNSSKSTIVHQTESGRGPDKSNCFSKFICCRRNRRNSSDSFKNNNVFPYTLEEYLRVPDSPLSSNADSRSTCFSSLSTEVNSVSSPTLSSSEPSGVFSSENSSTNLSHDSGFDEPKCFINMIYENHRCKGYYSCNKKDKASLNIHLKNLMNCMPKSFGDQDEPAHLTDTLRHMSSGTCLSKRRNAICETSDDMRVKFYEALCAFMTLQAMAKYDFL